MVLKYARNYHYIFDEFEATNKEYPATAFKRRNEEMENIRTDYIKEEKDKLNPLHRAHMLCINMIHRQIITLYEENN